MFIFTWLWPQLYYLFCVFSVVNIYKTLNKLSEIAFYNLSLWASRMSVTKGRGTVSHHVTVCLCVGLLPRKVKDTWFSGLFLFFITQASRRLGDSQRDTWAEWDSWLKCSLLVTCLAWPSSLCSSLHPINSPVDLEKLLFWRVVYYKSPEVSRKIY